jgi:(1->4)-alpha-D-glucan 1-alpha-D-glucosylmutase
VDWDLRSARLDEVRRARDAGVDGVPALDVLRQWRERLDDGTLKLYLTNRLLGLRRDDGVGLTGAIYAPLGVEGEHAERILAYRRGEGASARIVLVSRLTAALGSGAPIGERWGDTRLRTEDGVAEWRCLLSGVRAGGADGTIRFASALAELPVAVLAPTNSL